MVVEAGARELMGSKRSAVCTDVSRICGVVSFSAASGLLNGQSNAAATVPELP